MSLIELKNIRKQYLGATTPALDNLNMKVSTGEIVVLLGASGCGKTTTLRLIAGFEQPEVGEIRIGGKTVSSPSMFLPPEKRGVGMVFQDYALFPHLTVGQNIHFGIRGLPRAEQEKRVKRVLDLVGLAGREHHYPHQISGGQQQRVALARALAPRPSVILLDEPLSNLDADLRIRMRTELDTILRKARTTAIMVTHDQDDAFALADRVAILSEGRLEQVGTPEQVYHEPMTRFVADFVGQADFVSGTVVDGGAMTPLGFIPATTRFPVGEEIEVMVRPDDVALTANPSGNAQIVERQFRGSEIVYRVGLSNNERVQSVQASHIDLRVGERVTATAQPAHVVFFSVRTGEVDTCHHAVLQPIPKNVSEGHAARALRPQSLS